MKPKRRQMSREEWTLLGDAVKAAKDLLGKIALTTGRGVALAEAAKRLGLANARTVNRLIAKGLVKEAILPDYIRIRIFSSLVAS